jgi:hypothetical protein
LSRRAVLRRRQAIARDQAEKAEAELALMRSQNWEAWIIRAAEVAVDVWWEQVTHPGRRINVMHQGEL